ncbi:MAG: hypothetical protein AABW73_03755 [Nanoarchaeota archaeon]|mgnify:CR=1 FL=1
MSKNREQIKKQIIEFFANIKSKSPKNVKKIKTHAMSINLKLGKERKKFCKKCYHVYDKKDKIRITNNTKKVVCNNCGKISTWKIK